MSVQLSDGTTNADRWTVFTYPTRIMPTMERPISILFEDSLIPDGIASCLLSVSEAREMIAALQRAVAAREMTVGQFCRKITGADGQQ